LLAGVSRISKPLPCGYELVRPEARDSSSSPAAYLNTTVWSPLRKIRRSTKSCTAVASARRSESRPAAVKDKLERGSDRNCVGF
jgi:hypothetical protein